MPLSVSYDIRLNTVLKGIWSKNRKQVQQSSNHSSQSKSVLCKRIRKIPKSLIANIIFNVCLQLVELIGIIVTKELLEKKLLNQLCIISDVETETPRMNSV